MAKPYAIIGNHHTGLLVPDAKSTALPRLRDAVTRIKQSDILEIINDPGRLAGRDRFGSSYIKHQGNRGSCNGYAGAKALERARELAGQPYVPLSGEGLYAQINDGWDRGSGLQEGMEALISRGTSPEDMVPRETYLWRRISEEAKRAMPRFRIGEAYRVEDELELSWGLANQFVGVVAVHANNSFSRLDNDGVVTPTSGVGNHAVGVDDVRYFDNMFQFDMFNSWGLSYGWDGRGWLGWGLHFTKTIRYHSFYLIRAATEDPDDASALPEPEGADRDGSDEDDVSPTPSVLIEMGSRDNCGYCAKWKQEVMPRCFEQGWSVEENYSAGGVPRFTLHIGNQSVDRVGFWSFENLLYEVQRMTA